MATVTTNLFHSLHQRLSLPRFFIFLLAFGFSFTLALAVNKSPGISAIITVSLIGLGLLLRYWPEAVPILYFSSGVFKGVLQETLPIFRMIDLTILLAALAIALTFYRVMKRKQLFVLPLPPGFLPLLLLTAILAFSYTYSMGPKYGGYKLLSFIAFNISLFVIAAFFPQSARELRRLVYSYILVAIVITVLTGLIFYSYLQSGEVEKIMRLTFAGVNPISYSAYISGALLIIMTLWDEKWTIRRKILLALACFVFIIAILLANSRGPLFSLFVVGSGLIAVRIRQHPKVKQLFIAVAALIIFAVLLQALPENLISRYDISKSFSGATVVAPQNTISMRLRFWRHSLEMSTQSPLTFIFGNGIGSFARDYYHYDHRWYAHNIFIELFGEQGLLGVVAFVLFIGTVLANGFRRSARLEAGAKRIALSLLIVAGYFLLTAQFSGDLNDNRRLWFVLGLIGSQHIIVAVTNQKTDFDT